MNGEEIKNILCQIKNWLIIIAILLFVNTIILIVVNGDGIRNYNASSSSGSGSGAETSNDEINTNYDVSAFEKVSAEQLFSKINESGYHVVYIGRSTCGYCTRFLPVLEEAQNNLEFKTLYLDITEVIDFSANKIIDQDTYDKLTTYNSNFGATPMVLVFKDGAYVDGTVGYTDLETYVSFLNSVGIK